MVEVLHYNRPLSWLTGHWTYANTINMKVKSQYHARFSTKKLHLLSYKKKICSFYVYCVSYSTRKRHNACTQWPQSFPAVWTNAIEFKAHLNTFANTIEVVSSGEKMVLTLDKSFCNLSRIWLKDSFGVTSDNGQKTLCCSYRTIISFI